MEVLIFYSKRKPILNGAVGVDMNGQKNRMFPSEKQFSELLDKQHRIWQYPAPRFRLNNTTYRPDFYLPKENIYIEVVGTQQAYEKNKEKLYKFRKIYPKIILLVLDRNGIPVEKIAFKMGCSVATVMRWLKKESSPSPVELKLLQRILRGYQN